ARILLNLHGDAVDVDHAQGAAIGWVVSGLAVRAYESVENARLAEDSAWKPHDHELCPSRRTADVAGPDQDGQARIAEDGPALFSHLLREAGRRRGVGRG